MPIKKKVVVIGWTLLGVLFIGLLTVTLVAVLQGEGATPLKIMRGGKGGSFFPIELLTFFVVIVVIGVVWTWHRFFVSKGRRTNKDDG